MVSYLVDNSAEYIFWVGNGVITSLSLEVVWLSVKERLGRAQQKGNKLPSWCIFVMNTIKAEVG